MLSIYWNERDSLRRSRWELDPPPASSPGHGPKRAERSERPRRLKVDPIWGGRKTTQESPKRSPRGL
eukprot:1701224-Pyramimonas_sp.AAC.1